MADIVITSRSDNENYSKLSVSAVESDGTVLSNGSFTYVDSSYGKGRIKAMLAGGIATPVHYRRNGNVRKMFEKMHGIAAKEGASVALLHPFSFSYYRMFGYEKVADHLIMRFPTRMIDFVPRRCRFVPYDDGKLSDMIRIYDEFSKGRNLLLKRYDAANYVGSDKFTYICYQDEKPIAYLVYSTAHDLLVNHYSEGRLSIHELAYTSVDALKEIFSFLRMFEGEYEEIEFSNAAMCPEVDLLLRHYTHTYYQLLPDIMAKILNSEKMLLANSYPNKEGEFVLRINDEAPMVGGNFKVSYGGGDCRVLRSDKTPDIILSSTALSRLIYGYDGVNAELARYMDGVQIDGRAEGFFMAFPKRPCGIFEHF